MVSIPAETPCTKCTKKNGSSIAMCHGCQQSFCTRHFLKHRLQLSHQMDDLHDKYELFHQNLNRDNFEKPFLANIYAWERQSIRKIQEIAEKARENLQQWIDRTKTEAQNSLNEMVQHVRASQKSDNFTEMDLEKWTKQLSDLRDLLEKPSTISLVEDKKSSSVIRGIKLIEQSSLIPKTNGCTSQSHSERFVLIYGPCKLSEDDLVATQSNYRGGLSQISGIHNYSSGKHSIHYLIEKKGTKNIFFGIYSSSENNSSSFDSSVHGWWNLDYVIINGESQGGDKNEVIQKDDKITLILDCDNQQIQLEHHRTKQLVQLPIKLDVCPFPWKILVRLLTSGDCVRVLR